MHPAMVRRSLAQCISHSKWVWSFQLCAYVSVGVVPRCCGYYGEGNGDIYGAISCSGVEQNITNCDHTSSQYNHQNDVGVQCQQGQLYIALFKCELH